MAKNKKGLITAWRMAIKREDFDITHKFYKLGQFSFKEETRKKWCMS